ncbi:hypothetical protein I553_10669 [Mycobacterium xenopi 4042]|uniref:Uncharacterized protein n=1 Tax=Mycobacterium xenopi 4042 TaxID=1299334 RepID=X8DDG1_MYCXE|nr:hypothetical protein I552_0616 [Mycobacterium xenopi 3993]EUA41504.1 hypothetical protein I553_3395 [Mycobacterium xenopi 4042]EUA65540.1 hypothetical protein I553_10837 [Mycobacterium xenopi 4042]EUA72327.1 hypothetical protein I553_10649 [Mycobacterium xenopi 4042]EUA72334.1 hypothetical protein I553_10669 [Mycobacterium xenopi 4042]
MAQRQTVDESIGTIATAALRKTAAMRDGAHLLGLSCDAHLDSVRHCPIRRQRL